jgi:hypothetical protein
MKLPKFPHPSMYQLWHSLQYQVLPAPLRYTPTHAPGYWVETDYPTGTIERLKAEPPPFPLQKAVVNSMYELDCLMVAPGVLIMRTPRLDEFKPWFYRIDFEQIFGHQSLGVTPNFPLEYVPDSLIIATDVRACSEDWEPTECTKERWATQSRYPWVMPETGEDGPEMDRVKSGRPWEGAASALFVIQPADAPRPQSTTSAPSASCPTPGSTSTSSTTASAS